MAKCVNSNCLLHQYVYFAADYGSGHDRGSLYFGSRVSFSHTQGGESVFIPSCLSSEKSKSFSFFLRLL